MKSLAIAVLALMFAVPVRADRIFVRHGGASSVQGSNVVATLETGWDIVEVGNNPLGVVGDLRGAQIEAYPDVRTHTALDPTESLYQNGTLWHLKNIGVGGPPQSGGSCITDKDIDAGEAWDITTGDSTFVLGILDTGVQANSQFTGNLLPGYDFVNNDNNATDDNYHGTFCASEIGARANDGGMVGVCWRVNIMPLKTLDSQGSGLLSNAVLGLQYARQHGVKVTSNSWEAGIPLYDYHFDYPPLADEISACTAAGMLSVFAMGNENFNNDLCEPIKNMPAGLPDPGIVAVGASDCKDIKAFFSSWGVQSCDLFAPGVNVYGYDIRGPVVGPLSGTSMACPLVAGTAALVWGKYPSLTAQQIKTAIMSGVDPAVDLAFSCVSGGRLNAKGALDAAAGMLVGVGPAPTAEPKPSTMFSVPEAREMVKAGTRFYDVAGRLVREPAPGVYFVDKRMALVTR